MSVRFALTSLVMLFGVVACQSNGLVVETVNDHLNPKVDLPNSHADGDGSIAALTPPDSNNEWRVLALNSGRCT